MASSHPIVRQIHWVSIIPVCMIECAIILIYYLLGIAYFFVYGILTFLFLVYILSRVVPVHHRRGMRHIKKSQYKEALREYRQGYAFFKKHKWLDRYRFFFLISFSRMSFVEVAMINMAYCHAQMGNGEEAVALYKEVLEQFPNSQIAKSALQIFETARHIES